MKTFLGVDGGGSKTRFVLIDETGRVLARHEEGSAYYLEIGLDGLRAMLTRGIGATLRRAGLAAEELTFAFLGLPAYGEDSGLLAQLDAVAAPALPRARYRCGNDMVCGWAGALACEDGINVVAGTGSIAYGEYAGRSARAGGWGEVFGDEGSALWVAREGLRLFARMSDGRLPRGPLYECVRRHFGLADDLDVCAAVNGAARRSELAQLARLVSQAAAAADEAAQALFVSAAHELAGIVAAVRRALAIADGTVVPVSYSGGMFQLGELLLAPLRAELGRDGAAFRLTAPRLAPETGAALYAARLAGAALKAERLSGLYC